MSFEYAAQTPLESHGSMIKNSRWIQPARRLDADSKAALASAISRLLPEDRGWITLEEAGRLFSKMQPQYAFGEMDDEGKQNLEKFARDVSRQFEFWPNENRLYFSARSL